MDIQQLATRMAWLGARKVTRASFLARLAVELTAGRPGRTLFSEC